MAKITPRHKLTRILEAIRVIVQESRFREYRRPLRYHVALVYDILGSIMSDTRGENWIHTKHLFDTGANVRQIG